MSFTKEQQRLIQDMITKSVSTLPRSQDVERACTILIEASKDRAAYAKEKHGHDLNDIRQLADITKDCAPKHHKHPASDVDGLSAIIDGALSSIDIPSDYAKDVHTHVLSDLEGNLPVTRLEGGKTLLTALKALEEAVETHAHPHLEKTLHKLTARVDSLVIPDAYDDSGLRSEITELKAKIREEKPKAQNIVEVSILPQQAQMVRVECEYIVVSGDTGTVTVTDAAGKQGAAKSTQKGGKTLIRAEFSGEVVQPLSFTFSSIPPPALCSIGYSDSKSGN